MVFQGRSKVIDNHSRNGEYLEGLVDAKEAARILGVSSARWRQIAGSRESPNPDLGPLSVEPGRRGGRWRLRSVLEYAMRADQSTNAPVPALLPPAGGARYEPVERRVADAPPAREIQIRTAAGRQQHAVWAQLFSPTTYHRCGFEEPCVLFLTPLWPAGGIDVTANFWDIVIAALAVPGWRSSLGPRPAPLTVVTLGRDDRNTPTATPVAVHEVTADEIARLDTHASRTSPNSHDQMRLGSRPVDYWVPARDTAACLGWPALPWWPEGTASRSTCAIWEPGSPVTITAPASMAERSEAVTWLTNTAGHTTPAGLGDLMALISDVAPAQFSSTRASEPTLPDGFEVAVNISWPTAPDKPPSDARQDRALHAILDSPTTPPAVGRVLIDYFGDPAYTRPANVRLADLPPRWANLIRDHLEHAEPVERDVATPRWRMLEEARQVAGPVDPTAGRRVHFGPAQAPAIVDDQSVTWLAPTGYQAVDPDADHPHTALPAPDDPPHEVLFLHDGLDTQGAPRGWLRTATDAVMPLPGKSQARTDEYGHSVVLRAAILRTSVTDVLEQDRRRTLEAFEAREPVAPHEMERLLIALPQEPVTYEWSTLEHMALGQAPSGE